MGKALGRVSIPKIGRVKLEKIRKMVAEGSTRRNIARFLGISPATLYRRLETDETLKEALEIGQAEDYQECVNSFRKRGIEDGSYNHLAAYMRVIHKVDVNGGANTGGAGQIVVNLNLGQLQGQTIEGEILPSTFEE